jgi:hypothetical protein
MTTYDTAKEILRRSYPHAELRAQSLGEWQGDFSLPEEVAEYFAEFGPVNITIEGYGNPYFLPSLSRLWAHQTGYRIDGITHERILDWDDDWLVIADEGADPFIFSRSRAVILHAYHGEGVWEPQEMFVNLPEMVTTFAIIGDIVVTAGSSLTDHDSMILHSYRDEARERIAAVTGSYDRADILVSSLGWS